MGDRTKRWGRREEVVCGWRNEGRKGNEEGKGRNEQKKVKERRDMQSKVAIGEIIKDWRA